MGSAGESQVRVGVGVFAFRSRDDPRFCLGLRKGSIGSGTWSLAGGHLEVGETFEQCAIREVAEETGLEIENVRYLTAVETMFAAEGKHYVTIFMTAVVKVGDDGTIPDPVTLEPDKCEGWYWKSFLEARNIEERSEARLFEPICNLMNQRPAICDMLENGVTAVTSD